MRLHFYVRALIYVPDSSSLACTELIDLLAVSHCELFVQMLLELTASLVSG